MKYLHKTVLLSALVLSFLPACGRIKLKPLPTIPARQDNQIHVESHLLNGKETKEYLGFTFDKHSSLCAWHIIAYNPTHEELIVTSNSWAIKPCSLDELRPYIRARYYPYIPVGLAVGGVIGIGFAGLGIYYFIAAAGLAAFKMGAASNACCLYALTSAGICTGTLIGTPFLIYHVMNKKITAHSEALLPQLFPIDGVIPGQTNMQGIVILPRETLIEPWQIKLFDHRKNAYSFAFMNENMHA